MADLSYAELRFDAAVPATDELRAARAVEIEHCYGDNRLRVDLTALGTGTDDATGEDLRASLAGLPLLDASPAAAARWDVRLTRPANDLVALERRDGSLLATVPVGPDLGARLAELLAGESRWRFINNLRNEDPYAQVGIELRVVPVRTRTDAQGIVQEVLEEIAPELDAAGRPLIHRRAPT